GHHRTKLALASQCRVHRPAEAGDWRASSRRPSTSGGAWMTRTVAPRWSSRHTSKRRRDRSNPACNLAMGLLRARSLGDTWEIATKEALFMAFNHVAWRPPEPAAPGGGSCQ